MKKVLALLLALIMILSFGLTAFAESGQTLSILHLTEESNNKGSSKGKNGGKIEILDDKAGEVFEDGEENKVLVGPESEDYYFWFASMDGDKADKLKNIHLKTKGDISAEIVRFTPYSMFYSGQEFYIALYKDTAEFPDKVALTYSEGEKDKIHVLATYSDGETTEADVDYRFSEYGETVEEKLKGTATEYEFYVAVAKALNNKLNMKKFVVADKLGDHPDRYILVKVTTSDQYGISYQEGVVSVLATDADKKVSVSGELTLISDVNLFDEDEVLWAVEEGVELDVDDVRCYSDYYFSHDRNHEILFLEDERADVVTARTFQNIAGKDLTIITSAEPSDEKEKVPAMRAEVTIQKVAKEQHGVNFTFEGMKEKKEKGELSAYTFGFPGKQTISSDAEITFTFGSMTNADLMRAFGKDFEDSNEVVFTLLKDGKAAGEYKVSFANREDKVKLELKLKAGQTLGMYEICGEKVLPSESEEVNPDTGAPAYIGVASAAAVVSFLTLTALYLKNKE